jgi:hypothetical protein
MTHEQFIDYHRNSHANSLWPIRPCNAGSIDPNISPADQSKGGESRTTTVRHSDRQLGGAQVRHRGGLDGSAVLRHEAVDVAVRADDRLSKGTLTNADSTEREATDFDSERFRERVRVAARDIEPWDRDPPAHGGCVRSLHLR